MITFATAAQDREDAIVTSLRDYSRTSEEIALRIGLGAGNQVSARIRSMRERGYIQVSGTLKKADSSIVLVYALTKLGKKRSEEVRQRCPDNGACHHNCLKGECFRVHHASPLSLYGRNWKTEDTALADPPSIEAAIVS